MTVLTFKNRFGELVDVPAFPATAAKNSFGAVLEKVLAGGMVAITKRDQTKAVMISLDEYQALVAATPDPVGQLRSEFDELVAQMQTTKAKSAARSLFSATPAALGKAAVKATRGK